VTQSSASNDVGGLVAPGAILEVIASGFRFTEGPVWHEEGYLLFTDVGADAILRWDSERGAQTIRSPANIPNGMTRDPHGDLLVCEQATSTIVRYESNGTVAPVARQFEGRELNSPNDVVCRSDGIAYFTDPPAGRKGPHGIARPVPLDFAGVFLLRPGSNTPELQCDDMVLPNGLCFSPDEAVLYVDDTRQRNIVAFDVRSDGRLSNQRLHFQQPGPPPDPQLQRAGLETTGAPPVGVPDGMRADALGNIYCGGPGGIWVIDPNGRHLGTIRTPSFVGNLCWGDSDWRSLYICCASQLLRLRMSVRGAPPSFPSPQAAYGRSSI
jgi:gluconolactonase